ncbi:type II secretion system protein [bacterium]|nr:type II secretion system protein [bacterium]
MKNLMSHKKAQRGFTLIELAIIIAVLGILGAVGAVKIASMNEDAKKAGELTAVSNARSALAMAVAKANGAKVTPTNVADNMDGTTAVSGVDITWGKYKVTLTGSQTDVTGVATASYTP